jgi:hypothetical protein
MKKAVLALPVLLLASAAHAGQITSRITDSVQLTVEGPAVQSTRIGHSYAVSGVGVTTSDGTNSGVVGNAVLMTSDGFTAAPSTISASQATSGESFSFSASNLQGDSVVTSQSSISSAGRFDTPNLYGSSVTSAGGSAGALAGTINSGGVPTVTAGGPGTTAIGQRTLELSVFQ